GPGGVTTAQHDDCGDGGTVEAEARDLDFALAGEPSECRLDEGADTGMIARGSPGAALPARGLEREEIAERRLHLRRFAGDAERGGAVVAEPAQLAAQLLELLVRDRAFDIAGAVGAGHELRSRVAREVGAAAATSCERRVKSRRQRA